MVVGELSHVNSRFQQGDDGVELAPEQVALRDHCRLEHHDHHVRFVGGDGHHPRFGVVPITAAIAAWAGSVRVPMLFVDVA